MATPEEIKKQNIKEANEALGEQINMIAALADMMKDVVSQVRNKGELEKGSLDVSRQAVKLTRDLSSEYSSLDAVQKDIVKNQKAQQNISKQISAISQDLTSHEKEALKYYDSQNAKLNKAKQLEAEMLQAAKKGEAIDTNKLKGIQASISKHEEALAIAGTQLSTQAEQIVFLQAQNAELDKNAQYLAEMERRQLNLNAASGTFTKILQTVSSVLDKFGLGGLARALKIPEAIEDAQKFAYELTDGGKKSLGAIGKLKVAFKGLGTAIKLATGPLAILGLLATQFNKFQQRAKESATALRQMSQDTADLGRNLGLSAEKTAELASQAVSLGGSMGMTTAQAKAAAGEIYNALDGSEKLTNKTLQTFMKLKKFAGMSAEDLKNIHIFSKLTNQEASKVADDMANQAASSIKNLKLNVSMKNIMQSVGKVSNLVKLNFGGSAKEITKAVAQAKKLGLEMSQVESIAESLLNFEDSIAAEMEAELITGRQLNLEKAREAALSGDNVALMEALAEQGITAAEYSAMNRIEQQAIAKALGMNAGSMADMLTAQKENVAENVDLVDLQQQGIENMAGMISAMERMNQLEEQRLMANKDAGEEMTKFQEAMKELQTIVEPILNELFIPILTTITSIVESTSKLIGNLFGANNELTTQDKLVGGISASLLAILGSYKLYLGYQKASKLFDKVKKSDTLFFARYRMMEARDWLALQGKKLAGYAKEKAAILAQQAAKAGALLKDIGIATMRAISSLASIPVVGWGLGLAAAATVAAMAAKYTRGNDVLSPGKGTSGYGDRILFGPEGAISLNNKDTVVAGTDLFKGDDVVSAPEGTVKMTQSSNPNERLEGLVENLIAIVQQGGTVTLDGQKVGEALVMSSYRM